MNFRINPKLVERIQNLKKYNIYFYKAYSKTAEKTLIELDLEIALKVLEKIKSEIKDKAIQMYKKELEVEKLIRLQKSIFEKENVKLSYIKKAMQE